MLRQCQFENAVSIGSRAVGFEASRSCFRFVFPNPLRVPSTGGRLLSDSLWTESSRGRFNPQPRLNQEWREK